MSLHKVSELNNLPDPIKQYQFSFTISSMAGSDNFDPQRLELQCSSFSFPGSQIKTTSVVIGTHYRTRAALQDKSGTWRTIVYDTQGGEIILNIQKWMDLINNPVTGLIAPSAQYVKQGVIQLLNEKMSPIRSYTLYGLYPTAIGQIDIDPNSSQPVRVSIDWNYDWFTDKDIKSNKDGGLLAVNSFINPLSSLKF